MPLCPAVVIGSSQQASDFDEVRLAAAKIDLVRRHSGGGAVLVAPGQQVWLDVFVPNEDDVAEDDVGKSFYWLGDVFAASLANVLGASRDEARIEVNRGPALTTAWSKVLCFAGLGAGEVTVAGRKVVGMSQRRGRSGAWIHAMAVLGCRGANLADLLAGGASLRAEARAVLGTVGLTDAEHLVTPLTEELLSRLR
jgi:lipoate-protein ligase A